MSGLSWCAQMPLVEVPRSDMAKPLTLIYPFYENHDFFGQQLEGWAALPAYLLAHLSVIVVDDGSPVPASEVLMGRALPFPVRLFRIGVDVRWNWLAARNIGFHHAPEGWCLVTDMDHVVPERTLRSVLFGVHDGAVIYGFSRREHTGEQVSPHPNSWLVTRALFWRIGGYDETLSGHYGTDGDWRRRCLATAPMHILTDELIRHERQGDASTTRYLRKQPEDAGVKRLVQARKKGWRPKTLSFPYTEVDLTRAA